MQQQQQQQQQRVVTGMPEEEISQHQSKEHRTTAAKQQPATKGAAMLCECDAERVLLIMCHALVAAVSATTSVYKPACVYALSTRIEKMSQNYYYNYYCCCAALRSVRNHYIHTLAATTSNTTL
eukprot:17514-Heterococcus_DN1.PRE.2